MNYFFNYTSFIINNNIYKYAIASSVYFYNNITYYVLILFIDDDQNAPETSGPYVQS